MHILHIYIFVYFTARIDDEDEIDNWNDTDHRTGVRVFFRHSNQHMEPRQGSTLHYTAWLEDRGGGTHNRGYHALRWEMILTIFCMLILYILHINTKHAE